MIRNMLFELSGYWMLVVIVSTALSKF